jgi:hypothetical protein
MEKLIKRNLYSPEVYQECLNRIEKLTPQSKPLWGKMTAAQMFAHCAEIVEVSNGKELKNTPFLVKLFKGFVRNMVVNEKPYPKNSKTHPQYRQTTDCDFETEKKRLLAALDRFVNMDQKVSRNIKHPLFGEMSPEEKGWAMYKHLDHHLNQFGV